jgi:DNA ligase-1
MLAAAIKDPSKLQFPLWASPKFDGIRCVIRGGRALSRTLKPIPNNFVREILEALPLEGFDGELMIDGKFSQVASAIMSREGEPCFTYWAFDLTSEQERPYVRRHKELAERIDALPAGARECVKLTPQVIVSTLEEVQRVEETALADGYEGLILRTPEAIYKHGRSTVREQGLLKLKRFIDAEAEIIGFEEQMANNNALETDHLGYAKRSHAKAGKVGKGTLGALLVRDLESGVEFRLGTGLDDALRAEIWANQEVYLGELVTYKSQPHGKKDKPRLPVFLRFRAREDR